MDVSSVSQQHYQVLSRGIKPIRSQPASLRGWFLLFNHRGGYGNIEQLSSLQQQDIDVSHLPQPLPDACHGVLLLVCCMVYVNVLAFLMQFFSSAAKISQSLRAKCVSNFLSNDVACYVVLFFFLREFHSLSSFYHQEYAYDTVEVAAEISDPCAGVHIVHALAFKTSACALASPKTLPSHRYMNIIRQGAREARLDATYCSWLDRVPTEYA